MEALKNFWGKVKNIKWTENVKPVIAYPVAGGVLALAIVIGLIVLL